MKISSSSSDKISSPSVGDLNDLNTMFPERSMNDLVNVNEVKDLPYFVDFVKNIDKSGLPINEMNVGLGLDPSRNKEFDGITDAMDGIEGQAIELAQIRNAEILRGGGQDPGQYLEFKATSEDGYESYDSSERYEFNDPICARAPSPGNVKHLRGKYGAPVKPDPYGPVEMSERLISLGKELQQVRLRFKAHMAASGNDHGIDGGMQSHFGRVPK